MSHFIYSYAECILDECCYAECCYAECHYAECCGATIRKEAFWLVYLPLLSALTDRMCHFKGMFDMIRVFCKHLCSVRSVGLLVG